MRILFQTNQFSERGTEVAIYDYARYNESILGNESIIACKSTSVINPLVQEKFERMFKVFYYHDNEMLWDIIKKNKIDIFYTIKEGRNDGLFTEECKTCVHTVFMHNEPHGHVYAYVSRWLSNQMTSGKAPWVPHIIDLPKHDLNLRKTLNIPESAIVIGRHGGKDTFDLKFVKETVRCVAKKNSEMYFLFLNTHPLKKKYFWEKELKNIIYLPIVTDLSEKVKFINTCDSMLHARTGGETFGLSVGEFIKCGKPVLSYNKSPEMAHFDMFGEFITPYENSKQLTAVLKNLKPSNLISSENVMKQFSPKEVMAKFKNVFID